VRGPALAVALGIGLAAAAWVALVVAPTGSPARRPFGGFGEVAFRIEPDRRGCALLAARPAQWARGLMGRRDLGGYDAMVFDFGTEVASGFWMRNTPIPLTVAFFAADGRYLGARDMAPCGDRPDCPVYRAPRPYRYAIEVPRGRLPRLGVRPGSRLVLSGRC
jgi:uncharacterized membrane protein (UPF0127 family)